MSLSKDIIVILSHDYEVMEINQTLRNLVPDTKKMVGKNFLEFCEDTPILLTKIEFNSVLSDNKLEKRICSSNGEFNYFLWSLYKINSKDSNSPILLIANDITDMRRVSFLNKENQTQLERISEVVPGNFYWKNSGGTYLGCNLSLLTMLGMHSIQDIIGKSDCDLWPEQADDIRNHDKQVMLSKKTVYTEESVTVSGKNMFFAVMKMPLFGENDQVIGILGNSLDITKQKEMEEELKKAKEAAEIANIAKTQFIANMSHDIRTPLSGVVGLGGLVEKEIENPRHRMMVHDMVKSSNELLNMLNEILDVVSLGNITVEDIHEEPFHLPYLVQTIIDLEKSSVDLKEIELLSSIDEQVPTILFGDHQKLHHIVLNLVGNAIKFTKQGHVSIHVKLIEKQTHSVCLSFEISDTGMGVSLEDQEKVFDLFYKTTPSYKGIDKGHGIGLHIVKTYTELLGGKISVKSNLNQGSTFSFNLVFKLPDKDPMPLTTPPACLSQRRNEPKIITDTQANPIGDEVDTGPNAPKILIIEDNDVVRMVVKTMVRTAHCNPTTANDCETGLELAKSQSFDLILSDIGLPGISGIEFAKQLRQYEEENNKKPVPIVAVTGHGQTVYKDCLEAGINNVIIKPMRFEAFTELCVEFALFGGKQKIPPQVDKLDLQPVTQKQGVLGPDLPNTEPALFEIDNFPIFDMENAQKLLGDNTTILMKVLRDSIKIVIPEELPRLKKAHAAGDWVKVADIVHKLKGGFLSISLTRLGVACQYLERYHQAGHTASLEKLYKQFIKVLDMTCKQLKPWTE